MDRAIAGASVSPRGAAETFAPAGGGLAPLAPSAAAADAPAARTPDEEHAFPDRSLSLAVALPGVGQAPPPVRVAVPRIPLDEAMNSELATIHRGAMFGTRNVTPAPAVDRHRFVRYIHPNAGTPDAGRLTKQRLDLIKPDTTFPTAVNPPRPPQTAYDRTQNAAPVGQPPPLELCAGPLDPCDRCGGVGRNGRSANPCGCP